MKESKPSPCVYDVEESDNECEELEENVKSPSYFLSRDLENGRVFCSAISRALYRKQQPISNEYLQGLGAK